jgi:hypothetical protein
MSIQKLTLGHLIPAALVAAATLQAGSVFAVDNCVFDKYAPTSAAPLNANQSDGYGTYTYLKGAQLFVPAQPGLTREWLARSVEQALAADESCQPAVRPVQVTVTSASTGFWVQLGANDERTAKALLKWARTIVEEKTPHIPAAAGAQ